MAANGTKRRNTVGRAGCSSWSAAELAHASRPTHPRDFARATVNDRLDAARSKPACFTRTARRWSTGGRRAASFAFNRASGVVYCRRPRRRARRNFCDLSDLGVQRARARAPPD